MRRAGLRTHPLAQSPTSIFIGTCDLLAVVS